MSRELLAAVFLALSVTVALGTLTIRFARRTPRKPYDRAIVAAAATALGLWLAGLAIPLASYWLAETREPGPPAGETAEGPNDAAEVRPDAGPTAARSAPSGAAAGPGRTGGVGCAEAAGGLSQPLPPGLAPSDEWEYTLQPELPPALAEAEDEAWQESGPTGGLGLIALDAGEVEIDAVDSSAQEVRLRSISDHTIDLGGWSVLLDPGGTRDGLWCTFPDNLLLGPGATLHVLAGPAAVASGLGVGQAWGDSYVWSLDLLPLSGEEPLPGQLTLYNAAGEVLMVK